jgi:hypothetical protein
MSLSLRRLCGYLVGCAGCIRLCRWGSVAIRESECGDVIILCDQIHAIYFKRVSAIHF